MSYIPLIHLGAYRYIQDLQALQSQPQRSGNRAPKGLFEVELSLRQHMASWHEILLGHPDARFIDYVAQSIQNEFRIGFGGTLSSLSSVERNIPSAYQQLKEVNDHVTKKVVACNFIGPFMSRSLPDRRFYLLTESVWSQRATNPANGILSQTYHFLQVQV